MAKLADAPDLGSGPKGCGFKSLYSHLIYAAMPELVDEADSKSVGPKKLV